MIRISELRLGNYVYAGGPASEVIAINSTEVATSDNKGFLDPDFIDPIPLTPELLEKCGFKKEVGSDWMKHETNRYRFMFLEGETAFEYFNIIFPNSPKYLHQLQNFIFALRGEELKINGL